MALSPSEARALGAAEEFLTELADLHAETQIAEAGEYADPGDFADAVLNNLPAISYALNAGLPVTAWSPVQKNGAETERVLRAVRQWSEQARNLIEAYAAARITQDQLWGGLAAAYSQQSTNAFVAGRRAVGNLSPMGAAQQALLASQQAADLQRLQADAATGATGGGALSMLVKSMFDPTNFFGSGLPGDPLSPHHSTEKLATTMAHRVEQYGQSIASTSHLGEMSGLSEIPDEVVIVWWELGDADHCVDCIQLADMSPYLEDTLMADGIFPGSGHTQCGSNCGCSLNYDIPSEVCGDSLTDASEIGEAARNTRNIMRNTNDGTRYAVWVQEAASCDLPIGIEAFAGDVTPLDILDDDEAFSWDDDLALSMEGDLAASVGLAEADQQTWGWLADYLKADAAAERIGRLVMKADNVTYEFAWRQTADAVVFDFGRTTKGLSTLDPDMTLKALSQLSDRAAELKVPLRINADTAGPGMQKWLDAVATDRVVGTPLPPTVVPKWDFIPGPGPVTGAVTPSLPELTRLPEVDALPTITDAEAAKLTASTPLPVVTLSTGTTEKELFLDGNGQEWLAKSNAAKAEATATGIATDMGLRVVPVTRMGQTTALQPILKGARGIDSDIASQAEAFHQLTNAQAVEVMNQSPLDFVLGNNDAHSGQWIIDSEGKLWGVDKDASFMGMGFSPNDTYFWPSDEEYGTLIGAAFTNPLKSGLLAKVKPEDVAAALDRIDTYGADRLVEAMRNGGVLDSIPGAFGDEAGEALARARMGNVRNAFEQKFRQVIEGYDEAYRPPEWQAWLDAGGTFAKAAPAPSAVATVADILPAATEPVVAQISRDKAIDIATVLSGNYSGWAKDLTTSERSAFQLYQADSGASLADHLRKGTSTKIADVLAQATGQPTMAERIAAMDSAISRGVLPQDVAGYGGADLKRVFRGATDRHGVPKVGALISDPGYMSTSIDPKVAVKFAADRAEVQGGTPLVYRIAMPEGQTGVYLDEFFGGDLGYEREILLPRNSSFRVEAVTTGTDLGDGLKGIVVDLTPQAPPALAVLPKAPAKAALPASMRATATDISYVGTNRAAWQATFRPAKTLDEAVERLGDLIPGKNHLDEFSLSQMNVILARAETLDSMGFDLTRVTRLDDFAKVSADLKHGRVGLTKGHTIAIRHDAKWQFFPEAAIDQHPTIYDDVGGAFAHEYGHVLIEDLSPEGKKALAAIRDANANVALSDYATQDLDEWLGEVVSAVTQPGYLPGTLPFDQDVYALLGRERLLTQPKGELIAVGPPKALIDPAAGIKPGDTQMYLVADNPLPVNAPLAEWSGIIPKEPALPAGLKASKDEIATAKAEADASWLSWRDVAAGKTDVALTWSGAEREAGEQAGLIYREVKAPGAKSSTRFVARDKDAADRAEAWLMEPGHDATSDAFWVDVLGYTPEQIAKIDAADALAKGGKRLSAGVVMVEPDGRVWVLSPKNEFAGYQNTWVKGGVDEGETTAQAAVREMREESGFSVELDSYLGDYVNTDKTGLTRMYVGHRTGGGPMGAHLKETYKMRLLDQDEAAKLLTRYGKPDARDQTILADAMTAIKGEAPLTHYEIGADEVDHFRDLVTPKSYASAIDAPKGKTGGSIWDDMDRLGFGINPRPNLGPAASAQFGYDAKYVKQLAPTYVEYPASSTKFPYATSKWKLSTGEEQPMYWKVEAGSSATTPAAAAFTVPTPTPSIPGAPATLGVLSATEKTAVVDYSGGDYFWGVSQYLRGNAKGDKDTLRVIKGLDSAFAKAPEVKQTLYRGLGYENPFPVAPENLKPGVTFTDPGFGSTSKELGPAQTYGTLVMKIEPEGVRGIDVELATGIPDAVNQEIVLDRGVTYTVTKVEHKTLGVPYFDANGKYVFEGETDDFTIVTVTATKKAEATVVPGVAAPVPAGVGPAGTNRLFWANSKKQVADPHLRYNLHVAQLKTLLGKMADDTSIGALRVNDALLNQVPQLRELLVAAGGKTGLSEKWVELSASDGAKLKLTLEQDLPLPVPEPHVPAAPMVPAPKPTIASTTAATYLDTAVPYGVNPSPFADHHITWPDSSGGFDTSWRFNDDVGVINLDGTAATLPPEDAGAFLTAQLLLADEVGRSPGVLGPQYIHMSSDMWPTAKARLAAFGAAGDMGIAPEVLSTGKWRWNVDAVETWAAKVKGEMGDAGLDPALLKVDWTPMQPMGATQVAAASVPEATVAGYSAPAVAAAAQASVGDGTAIGKLVESVGEVKITVDGKPFVSSTYGASGDVYEWRRLGNMLEVHKVVGPVALDGQAGAAAHLVRMAKAMDEAPKIDGLRFTTAAYDQLSAVSPKVAQMLVDSGGKVYAGGVRLTREQVQAIRDQVLASASTAEAKVTAVAQAVPSTYPWSVAQPPIPGKFTYTKVKAPVESIWPGEAAAYNALTTLDERKAFLLYKQHGYGAVNGYLRDGTFVAGQNASIATKAELDNVIAKLDTIVEHKPLAQDTVVWRSSLTTDGLGLPGKAGLTDLQALVGKPITEAGYMSTTLDPAMWPYPYLLQMRAPKGTAAFYRGGGEHELLLGRGQTYTITGVTERQIVHDGKTTTQYVLTADILPATAKATEPAIIPLEDLLTGAAGVKAPAFVPTMGPKFDFDPKEVGTFSPTLIPQKQGFSKVEFTAAGAFAPAGSVRVRTLSKEIVFAGLSAEPGFAADILTARLRMLKSEIEAAPGIEQIRFDPAGISTLKGNLPSGIHAMLFKYGAIEVNDTIYLAREKAWKLAQDLDYEVKGTLGQLAPGKAAVADVVAAAPAPASAVNPDFWDKVEMSPDMLNPSFGWAATPSLGGEVDFSMPSATFTATVMSPYAFAPNQFGTLKALHLGVIGATPTEALLMLDDLTQRVVEGKIGAVVIAPSMIKTLGGQKVTEQLQALGAVWHTTNSTSLLIDKSTADNLWHAMHGNVPLSAAIPGPASVVSSLKGAAKLSDQFHFNPADIGSTTAETKTLMIGQGSGEVSEGLHGVKFEWDTGPGAPPVLKLEFDAAEPLATSLMVIADTADQVIPSGTTLIVKAPTSQSIIGNPLAEVLQAAGAVEGGKTYWFLTDVQAKALAQSVWNDAPLPRLKLGSAVVDTNAIEPSIVDLLKPEHPGFDDPADWAGVLSKPPITGVPVTSGAGTMQSVHWETPSGSAVTATMKVPGDGTVVVWEALGSSTSIPADEWAQVAIAQFHDLAAKLDSKLGVYSGTSLIKLDQLLVDSVPEVKTIAQAFGGVEISGSIILKSDQLKAIGKAIDSQIVSIPGSPAALAGVTQAKLAGGWSAAGAAEWTIGSGLKDMSLLGDSVMGPAGGWTTKVTKAYGGQLTMDWHAVTSMHALQWDQMTSVGAPIMGDDLTNAAGAFFHKLVAEAADSNAQVFVAYDVLEAMDPAIGKLMIDAGGAHIGTALPQWNDVKGITLTSADTKALLAKLDAEVPNPLGAVNPVAKVGEPVLDYDPAHISSVLSQQPVKVIDMGGYSKGIALSWNGPSDSSLVYKQAVGTLKQVTGINLPNATAGPGEDNALAALLGQFLVHVKADGGLPLFEKPVLDAYPGLRGTLKEIGFKGGDAGATSMTLLPEDLQGAIDKLMGGGGVAATPSTLLDPYIASVGGPDVVKAVKSAISATVLDALPKVADQPMAQGFGKLVSGTLETKYRASAKTITIKTTSGFAAFNDQLVTLLKVAEKVDAAPGVTSVVFETAWGDKSALAKKLLTDHGATDVGTGVVANREEMLKLRDAIMSDLKGLPAPVGSAAPVAGGATVAAAVKAPTYNVGALAGLGAGDIPTLYPGDLTNLGLALPPTANFAMEHGDTVVAVSLDDFYFEDATVNDIFHLTLLKAGPNPKQDVLAMLSGYGAEAEAGTSLPFFVPQKLLDSVPGLSRILKPYGTDVTGALGHAGLDEEGLLFTADKANELILHLYQGIPLADALPVAAAIPAAIVTEPLATKLGWDLTKVADFQPAPAAVSFMGGKRHAIVWKDITAPEPTSATGFKVPPGSDHVYLRTTYHDYAKHLVYEGDFATWQGPAPEAQRMAAAWKSMHHLAAEAAADGKPLLITSDAIAEHPEIGKLLDLYGAGPEKTFMKYTGRDLTPAQAQKLADDLAANAPITGAPSPAAAIPIAPAAAPVVPKSAAQIEADYIDELVKGNAVGGTVGGSLTYAIVADGLDNGVQTYVVNGATKATLQWSAADAAMHVEDIGIAGIGTVEAKVALADAAKLADHLGYPLLVDDAAITKALTDDMGGLVYWSTANDAWTTSEPAKLADYLLGKQKPPVGQALQKPIIAAPPPVPTVAAALPPPAAAASGMGDVYGFDHSAAKALADTLQPGYAIAPPKFTILNDTPLTKLYQTEWSNGAVLKWAEEQQGDARILRVRAATGGTAAAKADAVVASMIADWPAYLGTHPEVDRLLINKGALADTPALASMLGDAGWKETKEYWVIGRDAVGEMAKALDANGADWAVKSAIPTHVPAGGWSGALPTNPSPSFIYDYNPVTHQQLVASIVDKDIGPVDLGGGAGAGHELTVGKIKVTYSVSPSGNTIGIGKIEVDPTAASHEKVDAMMAALQHVGDQMAGRSGQMWVKPDLYQQVPGLSQVMKDAGAAEQTTAKIGDIIQMSSSQAAVLTKALKTDDMAGMTISISASSEYLNYNANLAAQMFAKEPADLGKGVLRYDTGATGAAKTAEAHIALSADGKSGELLDVKADASVTTITVASQINWFVTHGATDVLISTDTLAKVPKLDKYLVSLGGKIEGGGIRLTDQTLFKTRAALTKNLLPIPLGGDPTKFAFNVTDTMIAASDEVMQAIHSELVGTVGAKSVSEYIVNSRKIRVSFTRSEGNIYWEGIDRGDATIGMARSASVAQMRTFLNDMAQNAGLHRLDVSLDVLADQPGLRDVLRKYGAKEVAATADHPAYLSLERTHAMKLRKDVEAELGQLQGGTAAVINGQATITVWPVADELTIATKSLGGQTAKNVFRDAQGNEWMFKPGASGQGAAADKAAAEIAALMGLPVPPVRIYTLEVNGKLVEGSLQKLIPGAKGIEQMPLASLTATQQQALWQHSALDWVIANDDAHVGNWLIGPDGTFWGIDKTRAFKTFGDPRRDVLDVNSLGQGGTDAMAPSFFKWWKDARKNPALLQQVHPTTITKPLRALRAVDDATYRSIVTPLAKIAAGGNPKYKGDWAKMVEDMVARKNSAANDLQQFMAKQLTEIKRAGTPLPAEWERWLAGGGKLNLDATPKDLLVERLATLQGKYAGGAKINVSALNASEFSTLKSTMQAGYGAGTGLAQVKGAADFAAGHVAGRGYGYENVRPTLRKTPQGADTVTKWEELNEALVLQALFDPNPVGHAATLQRYFNEDTGRIRLIRQTGGYGNAQASLAGYTQSGFRNLLSTSLGSGGHGIGGSGVILYMEVEPRQFFTSMFGGFSAGEEEVAVADLSIDQIIAIRNKRDPIPVGDLMKYNGPVV